MAERFDRRFAAFGVGFPWAVAFCFAAVALMLRRAAPDPIGLHWQGNRADVTLSFPAFVLFVALAIGVLGSLFGLLAGARLRRRWLRRLLMGVSIFWSLLAASAGAAWLMGQQGLLSADDGGFDATVFALGSGAAVALGVIMIFVFQPIPLWNQHDERALAAAGAALAGVPRLKYWVAARSSSFVLLTMTALLIGGLLLLLNPWVSLALVLLLAVVAFSLFASVTIEDGTRHDAELLVRMGGVLPVIRRRIEDIRSVDLDEVLLWPAGGPGWRWIGGSRRFLTANGPALRLGCADGTELQISLPAGDSAPEIADYLRKRSRASD